MTVEFRDAVRENVPLLPGLAGGMTYESAHIRIHKPSRGAPWA